MNLSKRSWLGLSAVTGILTLAGGASYWNSYGSAQEEETPVAGAKPTAAVSAPAELANPIPVPSSVIDETTDSASFSVASNPAPAFGPAGFGQSNYGGQTTGSAQAATGSYSDADSPTVQYPYPVNQNPSGQYQTDQYPVGQYQMGQYQTDQVPAGQYQTDQNPVGQYQTDQYVIAQPPADQVPADRYQASPNGSAQYGASRGALNQYGADQYGAASVPQEAQSLNAIEQPVVGGDSRSTATDFGAIQDSAPAPADSSVRSYDPSVGAGSRYTPPAPYTVSGQAESSDAISGLRSTQPTVSSQPPAQPADTDSSYGVANGQQPYQPLYQQPYQPPAPTVSSQSPAMQYQPPQPTTPTPGGIGFATGPDLSRGSTVLAADTPGSRQLEGIQAPSVSVEKSGPDEIQIEIPASFETVVRNVSQTTARGIVLTDRVPFGTELIGTTPEANRLADGFLVWQLGDLEAGEEVKITMELLPKTEGEIGSVAQVSIQTQASVRAICTKPMLTLEHSAPSRVLIGDDVVFSITISNPGSGAATGVVIEEDVPLGLAHAAGRSLESEVGTLQPNEKRHMELVVQADAAGIVENLIRVRGNGKLFAKHRLQLEVVAPQLEVAIRGPTVRYLEREVTYKVEFYNPGTAPATNVDLVTYLPKGLEFVSADKKGKYDAQSHAVFWSLEQLPSDEMGVVQLTALPLETGEQILRAEAKADLNLSHQYDHTTYVESITELEFTVTDTQDPIEVGSVTTYEIRVVNQGSQKATNIRLSAQLPVELLAFAADGHTGIALQGQQLLMETISELPPRGEAIYRINVRGLQAGDHLIDVRLSSDQVPTPVTKQESTKVYADR